MQGMTIVADQSDVELVVGARAGDARSGALLLERHRDAVAELGPSPAFASVDASGRAALALVRSGQHELPFRAVWLGLHAQGTLPDSPTRDAVVWKAFLALPAAWRYAVWHREVEGQRAREIAHHLDMTEEQATRALVSAYAALKRRAALSHLTPGSSPECEELLDTYRFSPPSALATAEVRALREHGRHCDDCLELIRNLFLVEHTLRESLATAVLGDAAEAYLARRPRAARLRVPGAAPVRTERRLHPALGTFTAATIGAAAMALVLSTPALSPVRQGVPQATAGAPAPGTTLWPIEPPVRAAGVRTPDLGTVAPVAVEGQTTTEPGTGPQEGRGNGPGPAEPQQPAPTTPVAPPTAPVPAPTPGPSDGPGQAPDPGPAVSVDVDLSSEEASIAVDPNPGPSTPIEVEVPIPDPLPEVEVESPLSLPFAPVAPDALAGRVVL